MKQLLPILVIVLLPMGCGHSPSAVVDKSLDGAEKALVGVDIALEAAVAAWEAAAKARLRQCKAKGVATVAEAEACLGVFDEGKKLETIVEELSRNYDNAVQLLRRLRELNDQLGPYLDAARKEPK